MKKISILAAFTAVLSIMSCSTDDSLSSNVSAKTTSVAFQFDTPAPTVADLAVSAVASTSQVQRPVTIPVYVDQITIVAKLNGTEPYSTTGVFDLVAPSPTSTASKAFTLNDIGIGNNTVTFSTTTSSQQINKLQPHIANAGTADQILATIKAVNPYAVYGGVTTQDVYGDNVMNVITGILTTNNGRILTVFELDDDVSFRNKYKATITAKVDGVQLPGSTVIEMGNTTIGSGATASFQWSNSAAINGKKVVFTIVVTPKSNNYQQSKTYTIEQTIKASTSLNCIYTVNKDKAPSSKTSENKIELVFQEWKNENCQGPDCR